MRRAFVSEEKQAKQTALQQLLEKRRLKQQAPAPIPLSPGADVQDSSSESDSDSAAHPLPESRKNINRSNDGGLDSLLHGFKSFGLNGDPSTAATARRASYSSTQQDDATAGSQSSDDNDSAVETTASPAGTASNLILGPSKEFILNGAISSKLYPHQVTGVEWLYKLYKAEKGGILGDDMGLGKTMQCAAFISGLLNSKVARSIIIVAPKTLLAHWEKELKVCQVGRYIVDYYGGSEGTRAESLRIVSRTTSIMLTTYGMVQHNHKRLISPGNSRLQDEPFRWDVMILDEGHKIKNPKMQLYQRMEEIPVKMRVIISGTPIQNNLAELWALYNFCNPDLLGTKSWFKTQYENIITSGQDKNATTYQRQRGAAKAEELRKLIEPFFLRREKKTVLTGPVNPTEASAEEQGGAPAQAQPQGMPTKNDFIVWLRPKPLQESVYRAYLLSSAVKHALSTSNHVLAAITILKKICDHPALLSKRAANMVMAGARKWAGKGENDEDEESEEISEEESDDESDSMSDFIVDDSDEDEWQRKRDAKKKKQVVRRRGTQAALDEEWDQLDSGVESKILEHLENGHERGVDASCKTAFVLALLDQLHAEGHRTLVFSQSRVMLDIIQAGVREKGMRFCRIDGTMAKPADRQAEVNLFQRTPSIPVFLLTSQVGGLGLTITAADRVVIVDPAWNPAIDNQSVDRAYRIGQTKDVVVYRLITSGTVEEKIYRRQVFKAGLFRTGVEKGVQFRYFSQEEIRDLFAWKPDEVEESVTRKQLHELHANQRKWSEEVKQHVKFLETIDGFSGVSDHDLLFSKKSEDEAYHDLPPEAIATAPKPPAYYADRTAGSNTNSGLDDIMSKMQGMNIAGAKSSTPPAAPTKPGNQVMAAAMAEVEKYRSLLNYSSLKLDDEGRKKLVAKLEKCEEKVAMLMVEERRQARKREEGEKLKNITNLRTSPSTVGAAAGGPAKPAPSSTSSGQAPKPSHFQEPKPVRVKSEGSETTSPASTHSGSTAYGGSARSGVSAAYSGSAPLGAAAPYGGPTFRGATSNSGGSAALNGVTGSGRSAAVSGSTPYGGSAALSGSTAYGASATFGAAAAAMAVRSVHPRVKVEPEETRVKVEPDEGVRVKTEQHDPWVKVERVEPQVSSRSAEWVCKSCTYLHSGRERKFLTCAMCGEQRH